MAEHRDDRLNRILGDALSDCVLRALAHGFTKKEIDGAIAQGTNHGFYEFKHQSEIRKGLRPEIDEILESREEVMKSREGVVVCSCGCGATLPDNGLDEAGKPIKRRR